MLPSEVAVGPVTRSRPLRRFRESGKPPLGRISLTKPVAAVGNQPVMRLAPARGPCQLDAVHDLGRPQAKVKAVIVC